MLKRLLTAVLALGLLVAFCSTAFSDPTSVPGEVTGKTVMQTVKPYTGTISSRAMRIPFHKPNLTHPMQLGGPVAITSRPAPAGVDTLECYWWDYYSDGAAAYYVTMYDGTGPFVSEVIDMQYDVVNYPRYMARIDEVDAYIFEAHKGGGAGLQVEVKVWSDVLGMPGVVLGSAIYTLPQVDAPGGWFAFNLPTPVVTAGPKYHVSIGYAAGAVLGDDLSFVLSTAPTSGRGRYYYGGWYTMPDVFGGTDYDWAIVPHSCEFYSSCFSQLPGLGTGSGYLWLMPDNVGWAGGATSNGFGQRFVSTAEETITAVDVKNYSLPGYYTGTSTNGLVVEVWNDDGTGSIDNSGPIASVSVPGGAGLFPNTGIGGSGWNTVHVNIPSRPVVFGPWHVTVKASSDNPADGQLLGLITDPVGNPGPTGFSVGMTAPYSPYWQLGVNNTDPYWGFDAAYYIRTYRCKNEFELCQNQQTYMVQATKWLYMDSCGYYGSRNGVAQRIAALQINRVDKIRFQFDDQEVDGYPAWPHQIKVSIFPAGPGGVMIPTPTWSTVLSGAQLTRYPGWTEVVIPGGVTAINDFFVSMEPIFTGDGDTEEWIYMARERVADPGVTSLINGGMWVKLCADDTWYQNSSLAGTGADNAIFEASFCSIKPTEYTCGAPADMSQMGGDNGRTSHSCVSLSDAYCDLTLLWKYRDPNFQTSAGRMANANPVVFGDFVVGCFGSKYTVIDRLTGAALYSLAGSGAPNYIATTGLNMTPLITVVGTDTMLFVGGGGTRSLSAYILRTGAQVWSINSVTAGGMGYPAASPYIGNTAFVNPVLLGGVLYFATNDLNVFAANPATGVKVWGPTVVNGLTVKGLASDGTNLFVTTTAILGYNINGDLYKINAATGAIMWQLSTAGGLKGATVAPHGANESFPFGVACYKGEVYTVSTFATLPTVQPEYQGVFYRIDGTTGAVLSATGTEAVGQDAGLLVQGAVMVDEGNVIVPGASRYSSPMMLSGFLNAYNRYTGALAWSNNTGIPSSNYHIRSDGLLTYELNAADLGFIGNRNSYVQCFNATTGAMIFNRRWDYGAPNDGSVNNRAAGIALSKEGDLLVGTWAGEIFCLTKQADRPRLQIDDYAPECNTYGPLTSVIVHIPNVFRNTGCGTLTGTITFDETSNGSLPGVAPYPGTLNALADKLTNAATKFFPPENPNLETGTTATSRPALNGAASAMPPYLNVGTQTFSLAPGAQSDIILDVNQSMITRGPHYFYGSFASNDPDFFLNNLTEQPEVAITLVGGCIDDTTILHFGAANVQAVHNTGRLGVGDDVPKAFNIDGNGTMFYQGTYVYGVSAHRLAMSTWDWQPTNKGQWVSMQGDPNSCTSDCKPGLQSGVTLGQITGDGSLYTNLVGNVVCKTYIDSVQNFFDGTAWDWGYYIAPFDPDSTMGVKVTSRTIGFTTFPTEFPYLANCTVEFLTAMERNGNPLPNWKFGDMTDYDVGGDTARINFNISTAWSMPSVLTNKGAWGVIKLPYGGGCNSTVYPTIKNVKALNADSAQFNTAATEEGNQYWKNCYALMSLAPGGYAHKNVRSGSDQEFHATIMEHDFTGGDQIQFAIAQFGFPTQSNPGDANNYAPLSKILNKWVGMDRGDVNNDGAINIADIVYLADYVTYGSATAAHPGPIPFTHVGDVDANGLVNAADVQYLINYYFYYGPCPMSAYLTY